MPRPALAKVSTTALQAELERRVSKLASLLNIRERVDRDIAKLQALAGQFWCRQSPPRSPSPFGSIAAGR